MLKSLWGGGSQEQSSDGGSKEEDEKKNESGGEGDSDKAGGASSFGYWTKGLGGLMSSVGSYASTLKDTMTTTVQTTVESTAILNEFDREQKKFEREKQRQEDSTVPPWVGFNEEEQMKAQILELSADSRNVLRAPPPGIQFHFDFTKSYPVAMALLKEDPRLQKLRFELVPKKVKEEQFWHNYFYRVFLIKQSSQLSSLASESKSESSVGLAVESLGEESYPTSNPSLDHSFTDIGTQDHTQQQDMSEDFASDALVTAEEGEGQAISRESVKAELGQLGIEAVKGSATGQDAEQQEGEEWAQLSKELEDLGLDEEDGGAEGIGEEEWEQELNQMLGSHTSSDNT